MDERRTAERGAAAGAAGARPGAPTPILIVLTVLAGCTPPDEPPRAPLPPAAEVFVDATAAAGLDFVHFNGRTGEQSIVEVMGAGGALFDYDGDGDLDLLLLQGSLFEHGKTLADALDQPPHPPPFCDRLYRNDLETGTLRFTDVTVASGLAEIAVGYSLGVASGDFDNDGRTDLYVTRYGANQLLRNRGGGADGRVTFEDVTAATASGDDRFSVPAVFFDYDGDGWLDLWVGNYIDYPEDDPPICRDVTGARDYCGPDSYTPQPDRLLHNRGGSFEDVTAASGLAAAARPALGAVAADFDGDGWLDLYVAHDGRPNQLWHNRGGEADGLVTFTDEALMSGTALNAAGRAEGSMGVDAADFDGDGDLDLFMTHLATESNTLYRNDGHGLFRDATVASGLGPPSRVYTSFGTGALDFDGDGWLDLLIVNGAVNRIEALARAGDPYPLHQPNQLFRNRGDATFEDVTARAGAVFELSEVSRGAVFGDLDNDGDVDVVVTNNAGPARLLVNELGQGRAWLGVRLTAVTVAGGRPRDVPGASAAVLSGGRPGLWRRVRVDGSYASASDPRIVFGLGGGRPVEGVRVVWPGGAVEDFRDLRPGRYSTLRRGTGTTLEPSTRNNQ